MEGIAESGIAVEVSTAGLRKPVGEIYPSRAFAEMCIEAGAEFALSSDAHAPEQVGYGYDQAMDFLEGLGVERISVFESRRRRAVEIGRTGMDAAELGERSAGER
jgi:histidinol-phosphatase (PHP family)